MLTILAFLFFTALVAVLSYFITRGEDLGHAKGYFLAGRSLPWFVIAGSLYLTNISAEQLTGMNGEAFATGVSIGGWEATSAVALIAMALFFLPRYLKGAITTTPEFLERRFGRTMRSVASFIFLYALIIGFLPFVLYAGAITLGKLFDIGSLLNVSETAALWIMVVLLGVVGGCYAVVGGLKAVAVSDAINGVGLLVGGFLIPVLALHSLGEGSVAAGWNVLLQDAPERMRAAGGPEAPVPWTTLFTGILMVNLFYWCTNQAIIQRTLGARTLAEGQKGVLAAALLKIFGLVMLVLPGVIAWHMHQRGLIEVPVKEVTAGGEVLLNNDMAYPLLVRAVLPTWLTGFFGAVMFGAIMSSFNSGVNSMATIFSLDIYKHLIRKEATDMESVRAGKIFGAVLIVTCIGMAPAIGAASENLFTLMRTIMAVINVPILAVILMGILSKRAPALAGYIALPFGMAFFSFVNFGLDNDFGLFRLHWLHTTGLNMLLMLGIMTVVRYLKPLKEPFRQGDSGQVNVEPWKYAWPASLGIVVAMLALFVVFSSIGVLE